MACFYPLRAFKVSSPGEKDRIVFAERKKHEGRFGALRPSEIACGQCFGCRLERSRQWAVRCMHEASLYDQNSFVTLTFDDDNIPFRSSLEYATFQKFMKRLRKHMKQQVRFYMCGEYGEQTMRPHFHAILFNCGFDDRQKFRLLDSGCKLYTSKTLEKLWPFGMSSIGEVTFESAAYVARYVMKKMTGPGAEDHYRRVDEHGEYQLTPEFSHMSLKPGIGAPWLEKYAKDIYPLDYAVVGGKKLKPPKYYDRILQRVDVDSYEWLKYDRGVEAEKFADDNTEDRLAVKEHVLMAKMNQYRRVNVQ